VKLLICLVEFLFHNQFNLIRIKGTLAQILDEDEICFEYATIFKIEVRGRKELVVTFHTTRPGLLIGKAGGNMDKIKGVLEFSLKKPVKIHIVEIDALRVAMSLRRVYNKVQIWKIRREMFEQELL